MAKMKMLNAKTPGNNEETHLMSMDPLPIPASISKAKRFHSLLAFYH
jgi:hypothetical protein